MKMASSEVEGKNIPDLMDNGVRQGIKSSVNTA
jgi:hypothetical protein